MPSDPIVEKMRETNAQRTQGKWEHHNWDKMEKLHVIAINLQKETHCRGNADVPKTEADTEFVADCSVFVSHALAKLDELEKEVERLKEGMCAQCYNAYLEDMKDV